MFNILLTMMKNNQLNIKRITGDLKIQVGGLFFFLFFFRKLPQQKLS